MKENNPATNNADPTVVITNPQPSAQKLSEKIKTLGFTPVVFPTLEFSSALNQRALKESILALTNAHMLIFVSPRAVHYGMEAILNYGSSFPNLPYICMGPGTKQALQRYPIVQMLVPCSPPYESESLLSLPELHNVKNKNIVIFRGQGGRNLLSETLIQRQANVSIIECYQRTLPKIEFSSQKNNWLFSELVHSSPPITITTSNAGLNNLLVLLGFGTLDSKSSDLKSSDPKRWERFQNFPIIVVGSRMLQQAKSLGLKRCFQAEGADEKSLIATLHQVKSHLQNF